MVQPRSARSHGRTLVLFDVDGTLAVPAQKASGEMLELLARLRETHATGIVGAAEYEKQEVQLGGDLVGQFDFVFSENGVHAFRDREQIHCKSMREHLGEERWAAFEAGLDAILSEARAETQRLLEVASPGAQLAERGTFLQKRQCTVNVTPIGRTPGLSKEERAAYDAADTAAGLRRGIVRKIHEQFGPETPFKLVASIGGQIGLDLAPEGWDKTFCLRFVDESEFDTVHFFGDKCEPGGGDYELFRHPRTVGHAVTSAEDTTEQVRALLAASG
jgi:phosphomannomutase